MKRRIGTMLMAATLALAPLAQATSHQSAGFTDAEVRKVDKEAGKVTLKHGAIANLDMPPMTMVFRVKDAAMLDQVKTGDKVRFKAEKIQGAYTVTEVAPATPAPK
jgi:Cu(I)/Ag(I) efflux system protein CusF